MGKAHSSFIYQCNTMSARFDGQCHLVKVCSFSYEIIVQMPKDPAVRFTMSSIEDNLATFAVNFQWDVYLSMIFWIDHFHGLRDVGRFTTWRKRW